MLCRPFSCVTGCLRRIRSCSESESRGLMRRMRDGEGSPHTDNDGEALGVRREAQPLRLAGPAGQQGTFGARHFHAGLRPYSCSACADYVRAVGGV